MTLDATADETQPAEEQPEVTGVPAQRVDYFWDEDEGCLYWQSGPRSVRKVSNFKPEILEDIEVDHGSGSEDEENTRAWLVRFELQGGKTQTFVLAGKDKESAISLERALARECPAAFSVVPGMFGHIKAALSTLSDPVVRRVPGVTGWLQHGDEWVYLLPGAVGGIGPSGVDSTVKIDRERLPKGATIARSAFQPYGKGVRMPLTQAEKKEALRAFKLLVEAGPPEITFPIVLQIMGGPLVAAGAGEPPPLVHIMGKTGTLKTSYSLAALSLFGTFTATSPTPASWSSTTNFLQIILHITKDVTLLIDDYKRGTVSPAGVRNVVQNYADRTTRGRAKQNQEIGETKVPRGLLLTNGEDRWESEASTEARTIVVNLKRGDIDPTKLSLVQEAVREGSLQLFGGAYLVWVARSGLLDNDEFRSVQEKWHKRLVSLAKKRLIHYRILASLSTLLAIGSIVTRFVGDAYGSTAKEMVWSWVQVCARKLALGMGEHAKEVEESAAFTQLTTAVRDNIAGKKVCLYPGEGLGEDRNRIPSKPGCEVVGYYFEGDPAWVLLTRDTTFGWYERGMRSRGLNTPFTWSAFIREAEDENGGWRVDRRRIYNEDGKSPQLSGIAIPLDIVVEDL